MIRRIDILIYTLAVAAITSITTLASSQVQLGVPKYASIGGGPADKINLGSLNVHYQIPVRHKAGRGLAFNFDLSFDSSVWVPVASGSSKTWGLLADLGWSASSVDIGFLQDNFSSDSQFDYDCVVYYEGVGSGHSFPQCAKFDYINDIDYPISNSVTTDGSGYTLSYDPFVTGVGQLTTVEGNAIIPRNTTPLGPGVKAGSDIDRNGNEITANSSGTFTDTLGTTALTQSGGCTTISNCTPYVMSYTAPSGVVAPVTVTFKTYTVKSNFGCSGITEFPATTIDLVDKITLPDQTFYQFNYESTPGFSGDVTARVKSVQIPTGATISYTYSGGSNGIECTDGSTAGFTRTSPDGASTYARTLGTGNASTTTITDPSQNQTVISFQKDSATANNTNEYYETQRQIYSGSSSTGTLIMGGLGCYNNNANGCPNPTSVSSPITQTDYYVEPPGLSGSISETKYNGYGLPTDHKDFTWGNVLERELVYAYPSNLGNIKAFWQTITVKDGLGTTVAQTTNSFDQTAVISTSGTPQHVGVGSNPRGNLTTVTQLVQGTATLAKTNTYFDTGNLDVATDVNGATKTYTFGACGNSFVTQTNNQGLITSATWNCTGGVQISGTDESGNQTFTNYTTDADFWRPESSTDALENVTNFTYTGQTKTESVLSFNSGASAVDTLTTLDSQGRAFLTQTRQAPGSTNFDSVETFYDSLGRVTGTSLPYVGTAGQTSSAGPSPKTAFDSAGRAVQVTDNGGGSTTYSYTGNLVLVTAGPAPSGENTKRRQLAFDGLGRLSDICELTTATGSGTCVQGVTQTGYWTKYTYDPLDDLTSVTQNAQSATTQTRSYTYDGLGRLTSENNPESGTKTYTYDSIPVSPCNNVAQTFNGDLVRTEDANGTYTCFFYDLLHRLGSVGTNRPSTDGCKRFGYDNTNGVLGTKPTGVTISNSNGRLVEVETDNCTFPITAASIITDEWTSYSKRGEPTDFWESTPNSGGYYHVNAGYWPNGVQNTLTALLASGSAFVPAQTYGVDGEGRWKTVSASAGPNPVTTTSYNAASQITGITFGSSDTDAFTYNPSTDRMTKYTYTLNGSPEVGTLTWNPNSTLKTLAITDPFNSSDVQTCNYVYDDLSRISSASCGTPWAQTFSYDSFGNITKSGSVSWQPGYNQSTNHYSLAGTGYDSDGNLTNDSFRSYTWNAFGRPITIGTKTVLFDALDRIAESYDGTTHSQFVYSPAGGLLAKMNGQASSSVRIPLPMAWAVYGTNNTFNHYEHLDWLGSSRLSSTQSRTMSSDIAYAPFGEAYGSNASSGVSFTGMRSDIQTVTGVTTNGLYDFLARELPPTQGRWLGPDPAGINVADASDPQTWNRYAYLRNSPLNQIDQDGTDGWDDWGGFGGGFGSGDFCGDFMPCSGNGGGAILPGSLPGWLTPNQGIDWTAFFFGPMCSTARDCAMDMTPQDICDAGGGHCDEQDITEDCALKGIIAGSGLNKIGEIEMEGLKEELKDFLKGSFSKILTGIGLSRVSRGIITNYGGKVLAGYGVYKFASKGLSTFGQCVETEMNGTDWGWSKSAEE